jgi:hypothetical protein
MGGQPDQGDAMMMSGSVHRIASEDQEQRALFKWATMQSAKYPDLLKMFHIPNGKKRSHITAAILVGLGVKPGVSDIFLPVPRGVYHGMFIEMKRIKGGNESAEQKAFGDQVMGDGYRYTVCMGWEQAADRILQYLSLTYPPVRAS